MDVATLVIIVLVLIVILAVLLIIYLRSFAKEYSHNSTGSQKAPTKTFEELIAQIKSRQSSVAELKSALDEIVEFYAKIPDKVDHKEHEMFKVYEDILQSICTHPNTSKEIILKFNKSLEQKNPMYKKEINSAVKKGLDARR